MTSTTGRPGARDAGAAPATIKDVAARAGVSWKTVTNVVHERPNVRETTRARVLAAIEELGYHPSVVGRQLRRGRTSTLTLVVPEITNPYFAMLVEAVFAAAAARGHAVFVENAGSGREPEREAMAQAMRFAFDAVLISPTYTPVEELERLARRRPVVLLGESAWEAPLDRVAVDNVAAADDVTTHLLQSGRRRVAFVGTRHDGEPAEPSTVRRRGFRRALERAGLREEPALLAPAPGFTREDGYAGARRLLETSPDVDALVCVNDLVAIGALAALRDAGVRVPDDVAVTGWDDIPEASWAVPPLTSVRADLDVTAARVVDLALARIEDPTRPPQDVVAPHTVVVRASSGG